MTDVAASVQHYYGEVLSSSQDLRTSACCAAEAPPAHVRDALRNVHPEVLERFYGCGSPMPPALEGATILDLGCGTMDEHPHAFDLDDHHRLERGRPMLVCGNTADMLSGTRYAAHFGVAGNKRRHFGLFPCGSEANGANAGDAPCS